MLKTPDAPNLFNDTCGHCVSLLHLAVQTWGKLAKKEHFKDCICYLVAHHIQFVRSRLCSIQHLKHLQHLGATQDQRKVSQKSDSSQPARVFAFGLTADSEVSHFSSLPVKTWPQIYNFFYRRCDVVRDRSSCWSLVTNVGLFPFSSVSAQSHQSAFSTLINIWKTISKKPHRKTFYNSTSGCSCIYSFPACLSFFCISHPLVESWEIEFILFVPQSLFHFISLPFAPVFLTPSPHHTITHSLSLALD